MDPKTNSQPSVLIIDYGTGNLHSIKRCLDRLGARSAISSRAEDVAGADKIILPGVGHFGRAMTALCKSGLIHTLNEAAIVMRKPTLGICLGMELMAEYSEEGGAVGLGWLRGNTIGLRVEDKTRHKVPHVGWNTIRIKRASALLKDITEDNEFYFAHGYCLDVHDASYVLTETDYESSFPSSVERGNIFGVQFHPEKSHDAGARLLKNFVEL